MATELWARVRRLFLKPASSRQLELVLAGWRADQRTNDSGLEAKRELFHPLKGWIPEDAERAPGGLQAQRRFRHPVGGRTGAK